MLSDTASQIEMPNWKWPDSGWWFTTIGAVVGLGLLIAPDSVKLSFTLRVLLACLAVLSPAIWVASTFLTQVLFTVHKRARAYISIREAYNAIALEQQQSKSLINALMRERQYHRTLRIAYCYCYQEIAYIALTRKKGFRVQVGNAFTVVDQENGLVMGDFVVTEDHGESYIAKSLPNIDAVWLGYIHQAGAGRSEPPPTAVALFIESNGESNE